MHIEWNTVTWYSKLIAVLVFVATFAIAFYLGIAWERIHVEASLTETPSSVPAAEIGGAPVVGVGAHCGGFIKDAPVCANGFHCQLTVNRPDTGGTCVAD
jgi:hypothetical protein